MGGHDPLYVPPWNVSTLYSIIWPNEPFLLTPPPLYSSFYNFTSSVYTVTEGILSFTEWGPLYGRLKRNLSSRDMNTISRLSKEARDNALAPYVESSNLNQLLNRVQSGEISFDVAFPVSNSLRILCKDNFKFDKYGNVIQSCSKINKYSHLSPKKVDEKRKSRKRRRSTSNDELFWLQFEDEWAGVAQHLGFDEVDESFRLHEQAAEMLFGHTPIGPSPSALLAHQYLQQSYASQAACNTLSFFVDVGSKLSDTIFGCEKLVDKSFVSRFLTLRESEDYLVKLVEDMMILVYAIINSRNPYDRHVALITYLKLRGSPANFSVAALAANAIFSFMFSSPKLSEQSDEFFADARKFIDSYDKVKKLAIFKKTYRFCMYLLAQGICENFGVKFDTFNFTKIEEEAIKRDFTSRTNMVHCILDTALFYCEVGVQCFKTGNLYPLLHSGTSYEKWFDESRRLQRLALHTSNLEPHGTNTFEYITNLKKCIASGTSVKTFGVLDDAEKKLVKIQLEALMKIDNELLTRQKAMEERAAPFSLLIYGPSSVAKSAFKQLFFYHFGRVMNLPLSEEYKYTRTPGVEYWDNFQSSMWATVIDDAAYMNPQTGKEDTSVMEIIQMINNVAMVPNQADLKDKGRTPFLCKLVMATTNTRHLNANAYFSCPIAVARRFPYIVELKLKEEYADSQGMVDPTKMPQASNTQFPDVWKIIVTRPHAGEEAILPSYIKIKEFNSIYDFLKWSTGRIRAHEASQINALDTNKKMAQIEVCETCFMPDHHCDCENKTMDATITRLINDGNSGISEERLVEIRGLARGLSDLTVSDPIDVCNDQLADAFDKRLGVECYKKIIEEFKNRYPDLKEEASELYYRWITELCEQTMEARHWWLDYVDEQVVKMKQAYWNGTDTLRLYLGSLNCPACRNDESHNCEWGYTVYSDINYIPADEDMKIIMDSSKTIQIKAWFCNKVISWIEWFPFMLLLPIIFLFGSYWKFRLLRWFFNDWEAVYVLIRMMGHRAQRQIGFSRKTLYYLSVVSSVVLTYKLAQMVYDKLFSPQGSVEEQNVSLSRNIMVNNYLEEIDSNVELQMASVEAVREMARSKDVLYNNEYVDLSDILQPKASPLEVQGNVLSSDLGQKPVPNIDKKNVWYYNDPYIVCSADVSQTSRCLKGPEQEKILVNKIRDNIACYAAPKDGGKMRPETLCKSGVLFNISGQIWVTNYHGIPPPPFHLTLYRSEQQIGISTNIKDILVTENMLRCYVDMDLVFIDLKVLAPGYNLASYLGGPDLEGVFNGFYIGKDRSGVSSKLRIRNITKRDTPLTNIDPKGVQKCYMVPTWSGVVDQNTSHGSCGSPMVVFSDAGAVILGIHALGGDGMKCVSLSLTNRFYEKVIEEFKSPNISRGYIPISSESAPRELTNIHPKSPVLYTQSGTAYVYGSFKGFRVNHKSDVCKTSICDTVVKYGYKVETGKPCMSYMPYYHALQDMTKPVLTLDSDLLHICKNAFLSDILIALPESELSTLITLDDETAINGAVCVQYCDAMNKNTSIGAPFKRSKKHFLVEKEIKDGKIIYEFNTEIKKRTNDLLNQYCEGKMGHCQFDAHIKDEALPFRKIISEKSRIFTGAETPYCILVRKMFLTMVMLIQRNKEIFESYPGLVAQSAEWEKLLLTLRDEYEDNVKVREAISNFLAGDFKLFDKTMSALVMLLAFELIIDICKLSARSEMEYQIMWAIAYDTCFPTIDFNGDLIQFNGTNPSGHPLTVIINCIVLCLYFRYAFALLLREQGENNVEIDRQLREVFKKRVKIAAYGDDSVVAVRDLPWYNHTSIQRVLGQCGIEFTMADKLAESVPYISQNDISFLKRKWRWDEDINAYVAPLEESSIAKMLTMCVPKKTICAEARDIDTISTAVREYFFYGKEIFEQKRLLFQKIINECNLQCFVKESTLPTWEELRDNFYINSKGVNIYRKFA